MNLSLLVARKRRHLTQTQLAENAGVTQADISYIEKAGWVPPAEIQQRLAVALETTIEELFGADAKVAS